MKKLALTVYSICIFCCLTQIQAQDMKDSVLVKIETVDGNEFIGKVIERRDSILVFQSVEIGEIRIPYSFIKSEELIDPNKIKGGRLWFENPQSTRYFFAPNGYGLRKGEAYYQNVWVLFNQASIGITNHVSIGAGLVPAFLFGGPTPVWITPKVSIPIKKDVFNIGAGALVGTVLGQEDSGFGIAYGITTFGNRDSNISVGFGYGYSSSEGSNAQPTITISGMLRTGARGYLLTENYILSDLVILSFGGRRIIKKASIDFGLLYPATNDDFFILIPWLGLNIPFGNKKVLNQYQYSKK